jgi:hypothetical protein
MHTEHHYYSTLIIRKIKGFGFSKTLLACTEITRIHIIIIKKVYYMYFYSHFV